MVLEAYKETVFELSPFEDPSINFTTGSVIPFLLPSSFSSSDLIPTNS